MLVAEDIVNCPYVAASVKKHVSALPLLNH